MTYQGTRSVGGARALALLPFFFGDTRFFFGTKKEMGVITPPLGGAASPRPVRGAKTLALYARKKLACETGERPRSGRKGNCVSHNKKVRQRL